MTLPNVVFACVAEPNVKYLDQAMRLLLSLRWFGGSLAHSRFVLGTTGAIPLEYRRVFDQYRAEVVPVPRFDIRHGPSNKISLMKSPELAGHDSVVVMDCDTVIVRDPARWIQTSGIDAKTADLPTVTPDELDALFQYVGASPPPREFRHELTGDCCAAYCNSGVITIAETQREIFGREWDTWNQRLLDAPASLRFDRTFLDQASLAIAIHLSGLHFRPLPAEMNFPVHLPARAYPETWQHRDPHVIHYHDLARADGTLRRPPLGQCARRIDAFNAQMRAEGHVRANVPLTFPQSPAGTQGPDPGRKIVVGSGWWCDEQVHPWSIGSPATRSAEFFNLWHSQVLECLRPARIMVTDSASPVKPTSECYDRVQWVELDENYGHSNDIRTGHIVTKYSGFTRSMLNGAMFALCCDADFYVYVEQDCLLCGEDFLNHAIGDSTEEILVGPPTTNGRGLNGSEAAPMLQQSVVIVRRSGLEHFIEALLTSPWSDGEMPPEEIMRKQFRRYGYLQIPYGRSRPVDFTISHFYVQHLDDAELNTFLYRLRIQDAEG
jgi:hypothetical protein